MAAPAKPTKQTYTELQTAYDYFNRQLFGGELPPCLITLQRQARTYGYFFGDRWANQSGDIRDEIAMNPEKIARRTLERTLSTLVHEMVHLWQYHFGKPSRSGYHNKEWGTKMVAVGLFPSNTGEPGGKQTGQQMSHYIIEAGPFAVSCTQLLEKGFQISWIDRELGLVGKKPATRTKYTCPECGVNAWAKPDILLICGECQLTLEAEG